MIASFIPGWLLLLLLFTVLVVVKKKIGSRRQTNLPPGPPKLPIIGNLHQLGSLPHRSLAQMSKKYGPVILVQLGGVPTVVVSSAETAKEVLKVHDLDCCSRPSLAGTGRLSYDYLDIAFSPFSEYWREVRKICVLEIFSTKRVQSFRFIREEEIASQMKFIAQSASTSSPVDLNQKLLALTANVICRVGFGMSFQGSEIDNDRFHEVIYEALAMLGSFSAADFFPYVGWIADRLSGLHARREKSFHDLDAFYERAIDHHRRSKKAEEGKEDIIDVLLKLETEKVEIGDKPLSEHILKQSLMDVFLAGIDTAALTMTWAMTELIRNPRVMKKVQAEIREKIGNRGKVREEELDQLEYLQLVVKETFRLHAPGPLLIPREAMTEFKISGYTIYPKTRIQVNVWAIGRDPNIWKDPEEFIPERFQNSSIDFKGQNFELLPFGGGRRGCPGVYMGAVMVELALANLLYCFDWELPQGMKKEDISTEEAAGLTVHKKEHLRLVPITYN
ncbi:cytochrome P450 71B35-like [Carica papaya]|uniref:cytochrome P450 71B35-like n=1 Tax=Carica papaya TaxID=3649 RepID=UPI000B8CBA53|nr:cytochrome P450 71B35-like [Carica papaya]XP_021901246.1 cytochrome P450 71B35-like [Carica papaya]